MMESEDEVNMQTLIGWVPQLGRSCVHIKSPKRVKLLLDKIKIGGANSLQVIADFDHTITKQHISGERHVSSFCVINSCNGLPSDFQGKDSSLVKKYLPIERDPFLSKEEKTPHMIEWYSITSQLLTGFPLTSEEISNAVHRSHTELRSGTADLVNKLDSEKIPFLVFSAGLGDVVQAILQHHGVQNQNIHVISNFLKYDGGQVMGFNNEIVHPFNKNGKAAEHTKYFEMMSSRHNVILMGDSLGDADMADGVPNTDAVLKIGFLYGDITLNLPKYKDHFDIVLVDDQTMDVINAIFDCVRG